MQQDAWDAIGKLADMVGKMRGLQVDYGSRVETHMIDFEPLGVDVTFGTRKVEMEIATSMELEVVEKVKQFGVFLKWLAEMDKASKLYKRIEVNALERSKLNDIIHVKCTAKDDTGTEIDCLDWNAQTIQIGETRVPFLFADAKQADLEFKVRDDAGFRSWLFRPQLLQRDIQKVTVESVILHPTTRDIQFLSCLATPKTPNPGIDPSICEFVRADKLTINIRGIPVPLSFAFAKHEHSYQKVIEFRGLKDWAKKVDAEMHISKVEITGVDIFPTGALGFVKINASAKCGGLQVPGIAFMRGGSVAMLVICKVDNNPQKFAILTRQPRVPIGNSHFIELPAGMIDNSDNFIGVAARELKEEVGIEIGVDDMTDMTQKVFPDELGVYPSPGGCDEFMRYYVCHLTITQAQLDDLLSREHGEVKEGEKIKLIAVKLEDLWKKTPDSKVFVALHLYEKLKLTHGAKWIKAVVAEEFEETAAR